MAKYADAHTIDEMASLIKNHVIDEEKWYALLSQYKSADGAIPAIAAAIEDSDSNDVANIIWLFVYSAVIDWYQE